MDDKAPDQARREAVDPARVSTTSRRLEAERATAEAREDRVDAQSRASFPASDPPSWWGGR